MGGSENLAGGQFEDSYFTEGSTYGKYANQAAAERALARWYAGLIRFLAKEGVELASALSPVVEVGCGYGGMLAAMKDNGISAIGYDVSLYALGAVKRAHAHMPLVAADICNLPLSGGSIGTLVACEILEHVTSPEYAIEEMRRVIKPNGTVIVTTPNPLGDVLPFSNSNEDPTHISVMRPQQWERRFSAGGFGRVVCRTGLQVPYLWRISSRLSYIAPIPSVGPASIIVARP